MHVGRTSGPDCERPLLRFADGRTDGAVSADGRIRGDLCAWAVRRRRATCRAAVLVRRQRRRVLAMRRTSSGFSTRWPMHLGRRISIWTACSASPDEEQREQHQPLGHAGRLVQPQRGVMSAAVASRRPSPMKASSTSVVAIDPRTGQLQTERARHRGLGPSGVGRAVARASRQTAAHAPRRARRRSRARRQHEEERGQAGRRQIDHIVQPRRRPAERGVARRPVADHRIRGVRGLVDSRRRAGRRPPARSAGATTPSEKFSARLSIAARATPASSRRVGIAADDHRHGCAAGLQPFAVPARPRPRGHDRAGCAGPARLLRREDQDARNRRPG